MSFYDDASLIFDAGAAAGKDGKAYNVKPDGSLGSELIINGTFDSDSDWTKGFGFSISGGVASCDGSQSTTTSLHNTAGNGLVDGKTYRVEYTITSYTAGSVRVKAGNFGFGVYRSAAGTYVEHLVAGVSTFPTIQFNADADFVGSIDNVSCKEMDVADFTFTRGSNLSATRIGPDGFIEKGRENLLLHSNTFSETWTDPNADIDGGYAGYDGTNDAWELSLTGTYGQTAQAVSASGVNTFSFYAKRGTSDFTRPYIAGPNKYAYFDLLNGQTGLQTGVASSIEDAGNGWWRCSFTVEGTIAEVRIHVADGINTIGTATSGTIYIQDAQLEQGLVATDYIETGATTATAGLLENEPRFDYSGGGCPALLMEPSRTNLVPNSEGVVQSDNRVTITVNHGIAPDGTKSSLKVVKDGFDANDRIQPISNDNVALTNSSEYSISAFVKNIDCTGVTTLACRTDAGSNELFRQGFQWTGASLALTSDQASGTRTGAFVESYGNDWWRIGFTFTANSTAGNFELDIDRENGSATTSIETWGWQLEKGSYPTSYIPTYGSAVTRSKEGAADSYDQTAVLDLSSIGLDGEDVSWFFEFKNNQDVIRDNGNLNVKVSSDTSNLGSFRIYRASPDDTRKLTVVFQDTQDPPQFNPSGYQMTSENPKVVIKRTWSTGRIQVYVDGVSVIDATNSNLNRWYKLELAGDGSTLELKQVLAFPMVLSNNDSEILTGTSYTSFASMASTLSYTQYE